MSSNKENQMDTSPKVLPDFHKSDFPLETPDYLRKIYWWAYEHPFAVRFWDRDFLINFVLLGNYNRLVNVVLDEFPSPITGSMLQISNAYGQLVPRLQQQLGKNAHFDLIDILPIQLEKTRQKLEWPDERIRMFQCDATALQCSDNNYDHVLMFFLPHELPEKQRKLALSEAFRVVKPGGKLIFVEFHRPHVFNPFRLWQRLIFFLFEPFATDMWHHELIHYFPVDVKYKILNKTTYFGGLYQKLVVTKE